MEKKTYFGLENCRNGWAYKIHSRNLILGVFDAERKGFVGIREKFGNEYLFTEFHWDTGAPYGTVKPIQEIEECPVKDLREHFETICFKCSRKAHWVRNDLYGSGTGDWEHVDGPGDCVKILTGSGHYGSPSNTKLFDYLKELEKRFKEPQ